MALITRSLRTGKPGHRNMACHTRHADAYYVRSMPKSHGEPWFRGSWRFPAVAYSSSQRRCQCKKNAAIPLHIAGNKYKSFHRRSSDGCLFCYCLSRHPPRHEDPRRSEIRIRRRGVSWPPVVRLGIGVAPENDVSLIVFVLLSIERASVEESLVTCLGFILLHIDVLKQAANR
jgi:hypothetical protein